MGFGLIESGKAKRLRWWGEVLLVAVIVVVLWALFTAPTIVYFAPDNDDEVSF